MEQSINKEELKEHKARKQRCRDWYNSPSKSKALSGSSYSMFDLSEEVEED